MPIIDSWNSLSDSDWHAFAAAWLDELRGLSHDLTKDATELEHSVVMLSFTATPEQQWHFINTALQYAESDDDLSHIAAGPVEHLLSKHGDQYIAAVEARAMSDLTFARMITGVWQHMMADHVWQRIRAIQDACPEPLRNCGLTGDSSVDV